MTDSSPEPSSEVVAHLFRTEYGKILSVLVTGFGLGRLGEAEDIVQETLLAAVHSFSLRGIPKNPGAWLMQVAKNKALNQLKRTEFQRRVQPEPPGAEDAWAAATGSAPFSSEAGVVPPPEAFLNSDLEDSQLRMIFACCHPAIAVEDQLALVLKTLCGFGSRELASALLVPETTVNKRLYRARRELAERQIQLEVPGGAELQLRLRAVCQSVYLLFNEGYGPAISEEAIRRDFCAEALRLGEMLRARFVDEPSLPALLSLMYFHVARFDSRIDEHGALVPFEEQDRSLWDRSLIERGLLALSDAARGATLSQFHVEASIAAQHCLAPSFKETPWEFILELYEQLYRITGSPLVQLNIAIARSFIGPQADALSTAVSALSVLRTDKRLARYAPLHASLARMYLLQNNRAAAAESLTQALRFAASPQVAALLQRRLAELRPSSRN